MRWFERQGFLPVGSASALSSSPRSGTWSIREELEPDELATEVVLASEHFRTTTLARVSPTRAVTDLMHAAGSVSGVRRETVV
jgi:hypothetical protein